MSNPSHFVLTFLQSVGKRQEAEFYLRLFRELPKPSFAVIVAEPQVIEQAPASVIEPLRFLSQLDLFPVLALGVLGPTTTSSGEVQGWLAQEEVEVSEISTARADWVSQVRQALASERCVVTDLSDNPSAAPFELLKALITELGTRKLVVLRSVGGLGSKEAGRLPLSVTHRLVTSDSGISVINLRTDLAPLTTQAALDTGELELLDQVNTLHAAAPQLLTSVASPLNLLRELFTVKGAGTLIKTGSSINRLSTYSELELPRLNSLLEETFGRKLLPTFVNQEPLDIYLEHNYLGVAILVEGVGAAFLTKFAVNKKAQGEGIGRDLWEAVLRMHPKLYWRARANNPAIAWYQGECDGMQRCGDWLVFWKGISADFVPQVVSDALRREHDFGDPTT